MESVLLIDGENFKRKMKSVFLSYGRKEPIWHEYDFKGIFGKVLYGVNIDRKIFYFGRIKEDPATLKKSQELIQEQRLLKTHLERQEFEVEFAGRVRGQLGDGFLGKKIKIFKEKGVDVKIAVDMVTWSCDKKVNNIILASSDSDLQPAIKEVKNRGVYCIYLGFSLDPNKGLTASTNKTFLIRDSEIFEFEKTNF
ncbi:MAG: NYN domain-containing protein [Patescibacteria group bacterium]